MLPSLAQGLTGAFCPPGPAGPVLQNCYPVHAPPAHTVAVGCPLPVQDSVLVFADFSEVFIRPPLDFDLSAQQLCLPAYTTASSTNLVKMQSILVWVISQDAKGTGLVLTLEDHTIHNQPPVRPQSLDGYLLSPEVQSVLHPLLFHPSSQ